ncbi:hypothetical protein [Nocardia phage NBR1]|uniref:hypothetical protein n=1 Tax=Nocardia phage NBR1 TaxID=1109711 RepID=UPI00023EEDF9|nr:hypothetical protein NoPhNBR1_gp54 [Nocardia phage NBR1]AEV52267.1 hypothetical protein [Nocardia phage NBR1]
MNQAVYDSTAEQLFWVVTIDRRTAKASKEGPLYARDAHEIAMHAMAETETVTILVPCADDVKLEASE